MLLSDDINDYCFIDTETKALPWTRGTPDESVVSCGVARYSKCAKVTVIQHAIGDRPVHVSAFKDFDPTRTFLWEQGSIPEDLWAFHQRAQRGEAWYAAWNMAFDRLMLSTIPGCLILPEMTIDVMAQAAASNLPGKLQGASLAIGRKGKHEEGGKFIQMFTGADWETITPQTHPDDWHAFAYGYGAQDVVELREVFKATRQLPRREWEEYWASERINDRGMAVDVDFCDRAAALAAYSQARLHGICHRITGGAISKVTQRERIANWLYDHCSLSEAREKLVKVWREDEDAVDEDDALIPVKLSIAEDPLSAYIAFFDKLDEEQGLTDEEYDLLELAETRLFGASSTPGKFQKIVDMHDDGRLKHQYTFNGAQQTGRMSSRGVQVHNLVRASLTDKDHPGREIDAIEMINELELSYD